jgi:hypothetical protein
VDLDGCESVPINFSGASSDISCQAKIAKTYDFSHFHWILSGFLSIRNLRLSGNLPPFDKIIGREKD